MKAMVAIDVPMDALVVTGGEDFLSLYKFNTGVAEHYFCSNCGIHMFQRLRSDPSRYGVNGACFDGLGRFDFDEMPVHDGGSAHPKDTGQPTRVAGSARYDPQISGDTSLRT